MKRPFLLVSAVGLAAFSAFAQDYKVEAVSTPAPGLPAAYASLIDTQGYRVVGPKGPWCEVWFRKSIPTGPASTDASIAFPIAQGTLVGILRFPDQGADRRDQTIKPGVYTLRYSDFPVDGAHQGVAPQRDFLLITPVADDSDPNAKPGFEELVKMSEKASGTPHPAIFSIETPMDVKTFPAITKEGDRDYVLNVKIGDLPLGMIVAGAYQG